MAVIEKGLCFEASAYIAFVVVYDDAVFVRLRPSMLVREHRAFPMVFPLRTAPGGRHLEDQRGARALACGNIHPCLLPVRRLTLSPLRAAARG